MCNPLDEINKFNFTINNQAIHFWNILRLNHHSKPYRFVYLIARKNRDFFERKVIVPVAFHAMSSFYGKSNIYH